MSTNTNINTNIKKTFSNKKSLVEVNDKSSTFTLKNFINIPTKFLTNVNDKLFKDINKNTEGSDLKKEVKLYLIILLTIFLTLFLILSLITSMVAIRYYDEICSNNKILKDEMNTVYYLAIFNILFVIGFIGLFLLLYLINKELIGNQIYNIIKTMNDLNIIYWYGLLILIMNMYISSKLIIIISKCNFETNRLYYYLWINYAINLPICLLILILNIFYNKIK